MGENVHPAETINSSSGKRCKLVPLSGLRVFELKEELGKRGLDRTGIKVALIERLLMAIRNEGHNPETYQFSVVEYSKDSSSPPLSSDEQAENSAEAKDSNVLDSSSETATSHPESLRTMSDEKESDAKEIEDANALNEERKEHADKIDEEDVKISRVQDDTTGKNNRSDEERSVNMAGGQGEAQVEQGTTMRSSAQSSSSSPQNHHSLWVRGIGANTKASDLKNLFSRCGHVISAKIFIRRQQPKNLYIGFVTMIDLESAKRSIKTFNKTIFNDHPLNVQLVDKSKAFSIKAKNAAKTQLDVKQSSDATLDQSSPVEKNVAPQSDTQPNQNVSEQINTSSSDNELHIDEREESPEKENSEVNVRAVEEDTMKKDQLEETTKEMVMNDFEADQHDHQRRSAEDVRENEVKADECVHAEDRCSDKATPEKIVEKESGSTSNVNTPNEILKQTQPKLTNELLKSNNSLWIQGISSDTKAAHLKTMFSKCGRVLTSKIFVKRQQMSNSYFGFVAMINSQCADECVKQFHNAVLNGQQISVERVRSLHLSLSYYGMFKADCVDMAVRIPEMKKKSESDAEQRTSSSEKDSKNSMKGTKKHSIESKKDEKNSAFKKPSSPSDKETKLGKRSSSRHHRTSQSSEYEVADINLRLLISFYGDKIRLPTSTTIKWFSGNNRNADAPASGFKFKLRLNEAVAKVLEAHVVDIIFVHESSGSSKQAILISSRALDEYKWKRRKVLQMRQAARRYRPSIRPPTVSDDLLARAHKRDIRSNRSSAFPKPKSAPLPLSAISLVTAAKTSRTRRRSPPPGPSNMMRPISRRERLFPPRRPSPPYRRSLLTSNPPNVFEDQKRSPPHLLPIEDDRPVRHRLSPRAISPSMFVDERGIGRDVVPPPSHYRRRLSSHSRSRSRESRPRFEHSSPPLPPPAHTLPWSHDMCAARKEEEEQMRIREEERALHEERSRLKRERNRIERERKMIEKEQLKRQLRLKVDMERAAKREQEIDLQRAHDLERKRAEDSDRAAEKGLLNAEVELAQRERLAVEQKRLEAERERERAERERIMAERIAVERDHAAEREQRRMRKERFAEEKLRRENERMDHIRVEEEHKREERLRLERERVHAAGERVDRAERFKLEHHRIAEQQRMHKQHERERITGAERDSLRSKRGIRDRTSLHVEQQQSLAMERELLEKERVERVGLRPKRPRRDSSNAEKRRRESLTNDDGLRNAEPSRHKQDLSSSSSSYKGYSTYDEDSQIKKQLSYIEREKMELEQLRKLTEITTSSMLSTNFGSSSNCIADNNFIKSDHSIDHYRYYDERNMRVTEHYPDYRQDDRVPNYTGLSSTIVSGNAPSPSRYDSQRQYQNLRHDMSSIYPYDSNPSDQQNAAYDYRSNLNLQPYTHQESGYRPSERDVNEYNRYTTIDSGHQRGDSCKDVPLNATSASRYTSSLSSSVASRGPWTAHINPIASNSGSNNNANQAEGGLKPYTGYNMNAAVDSNKWQWPSSSQSMMQQRYIGTSDNVSSKWPISQQGMWRNDDKNVDRNEATNTSASFMNDYESSYQNQGAMSKRAIELRDVLRKSYVAESNPISAYDLNTSKNIPSSVTSSRYRAGVRLAY
ncbi:unnamed protein product [Anisakis simplex]|uniref:Scaffold attachment factor B1 n=1 Tax=Anisakis simplex TaxID=6269 RepID=A0A0M3K0M2_ANISI|nr:unnamed protein product [Anisakis simplex]